MDEKSMILEQERQEKAKKRKKYKKLKRIAGVLLIALVAGGTWYLLKGRYILAETDSATVEIVADDGQEIVYAQIVSINGNEITYTVTDMSIMDTIPSQDTDGEAQKESNFEGMDFGSRGNGQMPDMGSGQMPDMSSGQMPDMSSGQMPDMGDGQMPDMSSGQMPDMGNGQMPDMSSGQMPDMGSGQMPDMSSGQMPDMSSGQMPDMSSEQVTGEENGQMQGKEGSNGKENGRGNGSRPNGDMSQATETTEPAETVTTYIPVGTDVTTKLGTVTTFSRLAAGDYVALVVEQDDEEQIIMAVYIIG